MIIAPIVEDADGASLGRATLLSSRDTDAHQKNWLLWPRKTELEMSPWAYPLNVAAWDGARFTPRETLAGAPVLDGWRGSTMVLPWRGGGLAIVHHREQRDFGPDFTHRFIMFDRDWRVKSISDPFRFQSPGIEFACGIAARGRHVAIGYGIMDASAQIMLLQKGTVQRLLR
jgi:hypothetical protein